MSEPTRQNVLHGLDVLIASLTKREGSEKTNWTQFGSLMVEEKIDLLANAVAVLLLLERKRWESREESHE
jgi:hypothetical protein